MICICFLCLSRLQAYFVGSRGTWTEVKGWGCIEWHVQCSHTEENRCSAMMWIDWTCMCNKMTLFFLSSRSSCLSVQVLQHFCCCSPNIITFMPVHWAARILCFNAQDPTRRGECFFKCTRTCPQKRSMTWAPAFTRIFLPFGKVWVQSFV